VIGHRGRCVAVVGIDGVGKSTVVASVQAVEAARVRVIKVNIHRGRVHGRRWLVWSRNTVHGLRVLIGARLAILRGEAVLWDRHPIEDRVTASHGRRVMGKRRGWLVRLAPPLDVLVVLDAPAEHARRNRPSEDLARLAAMREAYLRLATTVPSVVIDARQTSDAVHDQVLQVLIGPTRERD
jgi:thymidylate kinase